MVDSDSPATYNLSGALMIIVGRPQPKELSQRIVFWIKIVGWEFGKVIVNFINCFVIRQVKVSCDY